MASATVSNPQTWNRYSYVLNKPTRLNDPSGMVPNEAIDTSFRRREQGVYAGESSWSLDDGVEFAGEVFAKNQRVAVADILLDANLGAAGEFMVAGQPNTVTQDNRTDCQRFADEVERIANEIIGSRPDTPGLDIRLFMDRLATTFTEFPRATLAAVSGLEESARPAMIFGSSGLARSYFEIDANQVRHAVGGLLAGYAGVPLNDPIFGLGMNNRENANDPDHGVPDINLNNQTVPMGRRLAQHNVGSMFNRNLPSRGTAAARGLANWIRNTLCGN